MANVEDLHQLLQKNGWHLKIDSIQQLINGGKESTDDIINAALNSDLTNIGEQLLATRLNGGNVNCIEGPLVLQILKLRSVSVPKENELASLAPQQLKLQLTDGHTFCDGLITDDVDGLMLNTPSGAKIVLNGVVPLSQNCLQLNSTNCCLLGGAVEKLPNSVVKKVTKTNGGAGEELQSKLNGVSSTVTPGHESSVDSDSESSKDKVATRNNDSHRPRQGSLNQRRQNHQTRSDDGSQGHHTENGSLDSPTALPEMRRRDGSDGYRYASRPRGGGRGSHDSGGRPSRHHVDEDGENVSSSRAPVPPTVFDYMPDTVKEEVKDVRVDGGSSSRPEVRGGHQRSHVEHDTPEAEVDDSYMYYNAREDRHSHGGPPFPPFASGNKYRNDLPPRFRRKQEQRERQGFMPMYMGNHSDGLDASDFPLPSEWDEVGDHHGGHHHDVRIRDHNSRGFVDPNRRLWDSGDDRLYRDRQGGNRQYRSRLFYNSNQQQGPWDGNYPPPNHMTPAGGYWMQQQQGRMMPAPVVGPPFGPYHQAHVGQQFVLPPDQQQPHLGRDHHAEMTWNPGGDGYAPSHHHHPHHLPHNHHHQHAAYFPPRPLVDRDPSIGVMAPGMDGQVMTIVQPTSAPPGRGGDYVQHVTQQMHDLNISQQQPYLGPASQSRMPIDQQGSVYVVAPYPASSQPPDSQPYVQVAPEVQAIEVYTPVDATGMYTVTDVEKPADSETRQDGYVDDKGAHAWQIGDYCMARYWQDGQLYRATIAAVQPESECCTVHFVDYGDIETVLWSDLVVVPADVWEYSGSVAVPTQSPVYMQGQPMTFAPQFESGYALNQPPMGVQVPMAGPPGITYMTPGMPVAAETAVYGMQPTIFISNSQPPA